MNAVAGVDVGGTKIGACIANASTGEVQARVSFSLVIDGCPFEGARGNAIVIGAPPVEACASGRAVARAAGRASAEEVLGDRAFAGVVSAATGSLGAALPMRANALDPARIVVGGRLGLEAGYRSAAVDAMRESIMAPETRTVPVVPAELGNLAGRLGAAMIGARQAERKLQ